MAGFGCEDAEAQLEMVEKGEKCEMWNKKEAVTARWHRKCDKRLCGKCEEGRWLALKFKLEDFILFWGFLGLFVMNFQSFLGFLICQPFLFIELFKKHSWQTAQ